MSNETQQGGGYIATGSVPVPLRQNLISIIGIDIVHTNHSGNTDHL